MSVQSQRSMKKDVPQGPPEQPQWVLRRTHQYDPLLGLEEPRRLLYEPEMQPVALSRNPIRKPKQDDAQLVTRPDPRPAPASPKLGQQYALQLHAAPGQRQLAA